jgi:hypothetical protein
MKLLVEWQLPGETIVIEEHLPQSHIVYHNANPTWPGVETEPSRSDNIMHEGVLNTRNFNC